MLTLLVPKAGSEQQRWQQIALANDVEFTMVDPWCLTVLPEQPTTKTMWMNVDQYQGVICVSPTAAKVLVDALDCYWPMPPIGVKWLCNGPRTASVLEAAGLTARYPSAGNTAEDVLQLPETQVATGDKWLIVKGEGGRVTYVDALTERGAHVIALDVYRREMNIDTLRGLPAHAQNCQVVWLSSEYLGAQMLQQDRDFWLTWPGQWWVSSPRMQIWAQQQGLQNTMVASGATPEAMSQILKQYQASEMAKKG